MQMNKTKNISIKNCVLVLVLAFVSVLKLNLSVASRVHLVSMPVCRRWPPMEGYLGEILFDDIVYLNIFS